MLVLREKAWSICEKVGGVGTYYWAKQVQRFLNNRKLQTAVDAFLAQPTIPLQDKLFIQRYITTSQLAIFKG